jgi:hypothetical protein
MSTEFHTPDQENSSPPLHQQGGGPSRVPHLGRGHWRGNGGRPGPSNAQRR